MSAEPEVSEDLVEDGGSIEVQSGRISLETGGIEV